MFDWTCLKRMLKYSIPLIPTAIMWWLVSSLNRPLLERHVGMFAIGLFAVANKLPNVLNMVLDYSTSMEYNGNRRICKRFSLYYNKMFQVVSVCRRFFAWYWSCFQSCLSCCLRQQNIWKLGSMFHCYVCRFYFQTLRLLLVLFYGNSEK